VAVGSSGDRRVDDPQPAGRRDHQVARVQSAVPDLAHISPAGLSPTPDQSPGVASEPRSPAAGRARASAPPPLPAA